ncbi:MAG: hypothetical protein P857_669 [Candidatus Xenolissoclinum pacificiensis L6]|uniref:Aminomethyltransferase folate-binding domain-containing protein n=1 Tax=Candidatus Xenolissoclinum pacificiensis L6 TaxID=1401685 RepID=W2UZ91_9RICK|nr:MAG: hypothetical protein P857_669 [Candidatus Xenolissoclinum pacificiensis L6]
MRRKQGIIGLRGGGVYSFLSSVFSNDLCLLNTQDIIYSMILNHKGRFVVDVFIIMYEGEYAIIYYEDSFQVLKERLLRLRLNSDVSFFPIDLPVFYTLSDNVLADVVFKDPRADLGYICIGYHTNSESLDIYEDYKGLLIDNKIVDSDILLSEKSFPLDYNLYCAFSQSKGCYIGQEVIMRILVKDIRRYRIVSIKGISDSVSMSEGMSLNHLGLDGECIYLANTSALLKIRNDYIQSHHNTLMIGGVKCEYSA